MNELRIQQGTTGEKIACNVFFKRGRFSSFSLGTYSPLDIVVDGDKNVQIKTLIPYVKEAYWSVTGKSQISNFLGAHEAYIISVPANLDSVPGRDQLWKYQGKMLSVNLDRLREGETSESLIIPMTDEFVEEYEDIGEEACLALLKYPVSYIAMKPETWKQHNHKRLTT